MDSTTERVVKLFDELIAEGEAIRQVCKKLYFSGQKRNVSPELFEEWRTKCLTLLKSTFGSSSPQYDGFARSKFFDYYNSTQIFLGVLKGAREDLRKGYFFHKDLMLSVNIFASLAARAQRFLSAGQTDRARAILEAVLAEALGKICENKRVPYGESESIESLAKRLAEVDVIPVEAAEHLVALHRLLGRPEGQSDRVAVESAGEWILEFLNHFLGNQILILN